MDTPTTITPSSMLSHKQIAGAVVGSAVGGTSAFCLLWIGKRYAGRNRQTPNTRGGFGKQTRGANAGALPHAPGSDQAGAGVGTAPCLAAEASSQPAADESTALTNLSTPTSNRAAARADRILPALPSLPRSYQTTVTESSEPSRLSAVSEAPNVDDGSEVLHGTRASDKETEDGSDGILVPYQLQSRLTTDGDSLPDLPPLPESRESLKINAAPDIYGINLLDEMV